ncbi:MAG: putative dehydrogenase [Oleiphilaceae bacterium]
MKVLLIGFGSIGKRHFVILSSFKNVTAIDVVTKQNIKNEDALFFKKLTDVHDIERYDYFVIASETAKHYQQLKYVCSKVDNKKVVVEKPLYDKRYEEFVCNNNVFTAYNLRFHPVLERLKSIIDNEQVYYVSAICGQYLPSWRPEQDYKLSYSADINQGGGVLRDLSHELDYLTWLFGDINKIDSINTKISDLDINSDDIFTAIAVTDHKTIVNVTVDYISKIPMRRLIVHAENSTIEVDLINNSITISDKKASVTVIKIEAKDRNYTYTKMHESIMNDEFKTICSFEEGKKVVDIIDGIEFKGL